MTDARPAPDRPRDVAGLVDLPALAEHLGVTPAAVRNALARGVNWLPAPAGQLHGYVWRLEDVAGVREVRPAPGRPRRARADTQS
jgi:hypothetical protein